jgi:hypothetical protein
MPALSLKALMADLGRFNQLKVLYSTPHGVYLDGGDH